MANPFLFDAPQQPPAQADNPFLTDSGVQPSMTTVQPQANPFLMGDQATPQQQYNAFGQPIPMHAVPPTPPVAPAAAAANPFADFGAPTPPINQEASMPEAPPPSEPNISELKLEEEPPPPPPEIPEHIASPKEEEVSAPLPESIPEPPGEDLVVPPVEKTVPVEEPLPSPPPSEEMVLDVKSPVQGDITVEAPVDSKVESEPAPVVEIETPEEQGPSTGANLFGLDKEPDIEEIKDEDVQEEVEQPKMSTGDAIFADLPPGDVSSTGASIFGLSEESAADTTGANLFGVTAPRAAQPSLGSMSGWDDNFDRKFDDAEQVEAVPVPIIPGDPFDPFAGTGAGTMAAASGGFGDNNFGQSSFNPVAPNSTPSVPRRTGDVPNAFADPMDVNNPFLDGGQAPFGDKKADNNEDEVDSPLFDDDTSKPLETFPRLVCDVPGWEMYIRHPPKKKLTAQR